MRQPDAAAVVEHVEAGDTVLLKLKDGKRFTMEVTAVADEAITGIWPNDGKTYRVTYDRISSIEETSFSGSKTLGAIGGGVLALYTVAALMLMYAIENSCLGDGT